MIRAPFGKADRPTLLATGVQNVPVINDHTILEPPTLTGASTYNLVISPEIVDGAMLELIIKTTGTEVTTLGTGFFASTAAITGVAGKTKTQRFIYDIAASAFKASSAVIQID